MSVNCKAGLGADLCMGRAIWGETRAPTVCYDVCVVPVYCIHAEVYFESIGDQNDLRVASECRHAVLKVPADTGGRLSGEYS